MATPLQVPRQYWGGFAKIRDLGHEPAEMLLSALRKAPPSFNEHSISSAVAAMTDTIAASDVEEIVPALLSLYSYRDLYQAPVPDVVEGITLGMEESGSERLELLPEEREPFKERLTKLLSVDALGVAVRGGDLLAENEHSFRDVRVLTDIRPIFEPDNPQATPKGAVIAHTIKISYWANNRSEEFFVVLDDAEIRGLLDQLERANSKSESLKALLERAKVQHISAE